MTRTTPGTLVAIEGTDGAGKATLGGAIRRLGEGEGLTVATLSFPRYDEPFGALVGRFLHGDLLPAGHHDSPWLAALLFAADRYESADSVRDSLAAHDLVLLDRYVASNMAYTAAQFPPPRRAPVADWIEDLEFGHFGIPRPALTIYVRTPRERSEELMERRPARPYTDRTQDRYEIDRGLMSAVAETYERLAQRPDWVAVDTVDPEGGLRSPAEIAAAVWPGIAAMIARGAAT